MICNCCKKEVQAGNQFCPYCGNPLNNQNNTNNSNNNDNNNNEPKKANIWLAILSWFIPLAGLIIFIVNFVINFHSKHISTSSINVFYCLFIVFHLSEVV